MAQLHVKIGAEPSIALPSNKNCAIYFQTCAKRDQKGGRVHVHSCKLAPARPFSACWEAGPEASSCDIQVYQGFRAAQVENLRHSKGSVSQFKFSSAVQLQLFTEMKYLASRQLWNLQTWKSQAQTLSCAMYSLQIPKWGLALHHP